MNELKAQMIRRIAATGPITVAEYMADCLLHPTLGYYSTRDPFGAAGDFTTAPEISQMFGELIGLWLAQTWLDQGRPAAFTLAEPGPGRGTLMADILRATRGVPGFHDAAEVHLIEAAATLRGVQRDRLSTITPTWHDDLATLPNDRPLYLVANEFFDALPIRQFQRAEGGWSEVQVGTDGNDLHFVLAAPLPLGVLDHRLADTKPGDIVETCAAAIAPVQEIAARIATHGGTALFIDYGGWHSLGDTLQALRNHQPDPPLAHPGAADLTAHVDFEALAHAATGVAVTKMTGQGAFLERLGLTARAHALAANLQGEALNSHIAAHRRLTHPQEMGTLFQTMALYPTDAPQPPGFDQ